MNSRGVKVYWKKIKTLSEKGKRVAWMVEDCDEIADAEILQRLGSKCWGIGGEFGSHKVDSWTLIILRSMFFCSVSIQFSTTLFHTTTLASSISLGIDNSEGGWLSHWIFFSLHKNTYHSQENKIKNYLILFFKIFNNSCMEDGFRKFTVFF